MSALEIPISYDKRGMREVGQIWRLHCQGKFADFALCFKEVGLERIKWNMIGNTITEEFRNRTYVFPC